MAAQFVWAEALQALGQPMAVISTLFLGTSVVQPMEGPYVAGIANTFRALGSVLGGALTGQLMTARGNFHTEMLLDQAGRLLPNLPPAGPALDALPALVAQQAGVLAAADVYRALGVLALLLIPFAQMLRRVPAPARHPSTDPPPVARAGAVS
jgi:DHA2 family multidrug resistance protein